MAILALLAEEPMHPYRMQQLIKERGKDQIINVRQRASIYQTIERLLRDGQISVKETLRETGKPDRTVYEITKEGREILIEWIREVLSTPIQEFPNFPVAISYISILSPQDALEKLEQRIDVLEKTVQQIDNNLQTYKSLIPRLFMLESEYQKTVLAAELEWVRSASEDIRNGSLFWNDEWLRDIAERLTSQEE
ncbi:TPA: PadR family transcriptional regulator [Bacillus thuringiensis]|nr:PadR family transcriptional regulator [Bacillus thuringiensis]EKS7870395.1 PadR family transcriptional regulator [Bacillus cereus]RUR60453.1 PadR family transcriptional regulator [Bacillus sp. VKPM B-3276]MRA99668.1 PadR family transcriptional regulator [Bacillus thuringiensis]QGV10769.1 PadR family transcriptional regulator [Bacillus cereus]RNG62692.1 PadR family transcriptional regulator [Bacillus thuringiensis]